jgi:hypothetical protein
MAQQVDYICIILLRTRISFQTFVHMKVVAEYAQVAEVADDEEQEFKVYFEISV